MSDRENDAIARGEQNLKDLEIPCVRLLPRLLEGLAPESCRLPFRKSDQEHVDSAGDPAEHPDCGNLVHQFDSGHRT